MLNRGGLMDRFEWIALSSIAMPVVTIVISFISKHLIGFTKGVHVLYSLISKVTSHRRNLNIPIKCLVLISNVYVKCETKKNWCTFEKLRQNSSIPG